MKKKSKKERFNVLSTLRRTLKELWNVDKGIFFHAVLYTIVFTIYSFMSVILPKLAIGVIETGGDKVIQNLFTTLISYFAIGSIISFLQNKEDQHLSGRCMKDRLNFIDKGLLKMMKADYCYAEDASFLNEFEKGMTAVESDSSGLQAVYKNLYKTSPLFITIIIMFILTARLNPIILLALIIHTAVSIAVSENKQQFRYSHKKEEARLSRKISYYAKTSADFDFGKDIRIFNLGKHILDNQKREIDTYIALLKKLTRHDFLMSLVSLLTLLGTNVAMYGILIKETLDGMSISSFTMYIAVITSLQTMLDSFANNMTDIFKFSQMIYDFYNLLDKKLSNTEGIDFKTEDTLEIKFDNVSFKYPGTDRWIIKNLNLTISKGERLAIVGINGAGKSTIVKLMTGLFAPTEGHIYINGKDITTIKTESLHKQFSAVFQDVNVFAFSIEENVACTDKDIDEDKVNQVLKKVNLYDKVQGFDKKTKQMMLKVIDENGTDFSGGEKQKLSIARGLYKDAPMVIMDEPTAALDALAEAEIYQSFSDMVKGKTAVYISHRLASTKFCDKIALFSKEGLIEYGTHDELLAKKGEYYNMFVIQGKYYQEEAV